MTETPTTRLFDLLPQIYRIRDADPAQRGALEAMLDVIDNQVGVVRENIRELWDNYFIETCDDWVIPYIGDLVGVNLVNPVVLRARTDVAKTIHYRRRKGTVLMLEELARDVTGWSAKVVEFFQILGWTQNANHVRINSGGWFDVQDDTICNAVGTAFDQAAHTVDVRQPAQNEGWYNIHNIGFFLWRLQPYAMLNADPQPLAGFPHRFHFNSLGQPEPLFIQPDMAGLSERAADEDDVSSPISPRQLKPDVVAYTQADPPDASGRVLLHMIPPDQPLVSTWPAGLWLELLDPLDATKTLPAILNEVRGKGAELLVAPGAALTTQSQVRAFPFLPVYYGQPRGFSVFAGGELVSPDPAVTANAAHRRRVLIGDLCAWADPAPGTLVIDVRLGRFAFAPTETPADPITVSYSYGFSGNIGAGPYDRPVTGAPTTQVGQAAGVSLDQALTAWQTNPPPAAIIEIQDSHTYPLNLASLAMPNQLFQLTIRALSGERPTVILNGGLALTGGDPSASLTLEGLLISGGMIDLQGALQTLTIRNCMLDPGGGLSSDGVTLRPPQTSLKVSAGDSSLTLLVQQSITGAILAPDAIESLQMSDSLVDAQGGTALSGLNGAGDDGPRSSIISSTIFGQCWLHELSLGSEDLFAGVLTVRRKQNGCVRFSYLAPGSATPRRYHCLPPDGATPDEIARLTPSFTSTRFGDPGYAQLSRSGPVEIATGASDGSEMGCFFLLKNPLRRQNLVMRLEEYLPFGLTAALIDVT